MCWKKLNKPVTMNLTIKNWGGKFYFSQFQAQVETTCRKLTALFNAEQCYNQFLKPKIEHNRITSLNFPYLES